MPIDRKAVQDRLKKFDFSGLFTQELGWDWHTTNLAITLDGQPLTLNAVAHKRGMVAYHCPAPAGVRIPEYTLRRKIEQQVTKSTHEHLIIFSDSAQTTQIWQWVKREPGKPAACREHTFQKNQSGEALIQKLQVIAFTLEEEDALSLPDVIRRARAFDVEHVTKRFYDQFKKEHASFLKFVEGIDDVADCEWYASVMLNRLMFVYFVQRKGFLDGDPHYLRNRLKRCQQEKGKDKFYSFYRCFLLKLFHDGLGGKARPKELQDLLGRIPYLNGGFFEKHVIEQRWDAIQIPDRAFERIFDYFDQWQWHLDERPLHDDKEINPAVLGFIFEKYINQKQMGAYYTQEDITGYMSRNTIIAFLFDAAHKEHKAAFEGDNAVWKLLQADPDRYIYPTIKHGITLDIHAQPPTALKTRLPLPPEIEQGVDTTKPKLIERRKAWNKTAPSEYALPTEIWREVVARRQRYDDLRGKLASGQVRDINDLITLNLDIVQFAQDVIRNCDSPELLRAFWHALEKLSVLDPTVGSGAFLFAALNILKPLYEACLERMEAFVGDLERSGEKHRPEKFSDFRAVLERVEAHPNSDYFILKSIILNNLFGVDIMEEATEICKLRLFLKLAAQVEPDPTKDNFGIEPLPDIDFNIRAGNTLVGYATADEVRRAFKEEAGGQGKLLLGESSTAYKRFEENVELADRAFRQFREMQTNHGMDTKDFSEAKKNLRQRLNGLEDELNRYLAGDCGVKNGAKLSDSDWLTSHQPFHWFVEFYGLVASGGFDVIIGNPPYAEIPKHLNRQLLRSTFTSALERWSRDEDLYTLVVERSLKLLKSATGRFGMILPLSVAFSTKRPFITLRQVLAKEQGLWLWSHFDRIPSALFGNEVRTRCTIALLSRSHSARHFMGATTALLRWNAEFRSHLFNTMSYAMLDVDISAGIPKVSTQVQADTLKTLFKSASPLARDLARSIPFNDLAAVSPRFPQPCVYVGGTAYNWFPAWRDIPETTNIDGEPSLPARTAGFRFQDEDSANIVFALLCSSMGYWWWVVASDAFNLKKWLLERFPISISMIPPEARKPLAQLGAALRQELNRNYVYKDNKGRIGNLFLPACERETSAIDAFLASSVPGLSADFFEDIQNFNACFSRAETDESEVEDDE